MAVGRWTWLRTLKRHPREAHSATQAMRKSARREWDEPWGCMYGKAFRATLFEEGLFRAGPLIIVMWVHANPGPIVLALLWVFLQSLWILCHPIVWSLAALSQSDDRNRSAVADLASLYRLVGHGAILNGVWWGNYVVLYHPSLPLPWGAMVSIATAMSMIVHGWWNTRVAQPNPWCTALRNWACPWISDNTDTPYDLSLK